MQLLFFSSFLGLFIWTSLTFIVLAFKRWNAYGATQWRDSKLNSLYTWSYLAKQYTWREQILLLAGSDARGTDVPRGRRKAPETWEENNTMNMAIGRIYFVKREGNQHVSRPFPFACNCPVVHVHFRGTARPLHCCELCSVLFSCELMYLTVCTYAVDARKVLRRTYEPIAI